MRITHITIDNLFGLFNHEIPLFGQDRITIIHGPNGYGKTSVLRLIQSLFSENNFYLVKIPFDKIAIRFDDEREFRIHKKMHAETLLTEEVVFSFAENSFSLKPIVTGKKHRRRSIGKSALSPQQIWQLEELQEPTTFKDFLEKAAEIYELIYPAPAIPQPEWLQKLRSSIPVRMIEAQRLMQFSRSAAGSSVEEQTPLPSVIEYSNEIVGVINSRLAEYAALSQSLDRTFPQRMLQQLDSDQVRQENDLRRQLRDLEKKRLRFINVGILDSEDFSFELPENIDETALVMLTIYMNDVEKKLAILDQLADKIELFKNTVNHLFDYKWMEISKHSGFRFFSSTHNELEPADLSSGEQHEIVLLYELLFKTDSDSLILIDEPELSLHVLWQEAFLHDLQQVTQVAELDVIISTHSPQLIHDRWDLTVELKGPTE